MIATEGRCQALTLSGEPCRRPLNTRSSSARLCGLHELARRRVESGIVGWAQRWRGYAMTPAEDMLAERDTARSRLVEILAEEIRRLELEAPDGDEDPLELAGILADAVIAHGWPGS